MNKLREKTTATLLIAVFMISIFAVVIPVSAATTYTVDDDWQIGSPPYAEDTDLDTDFATIQAAIDAAISGDTISVATGTYSERNDIGVGTKSAGIMIDKSLTVVSVDGAEVTIIDAQEADMGVLINGEGTIATFDGFTVENYDTAGILAGAFGDWGEDPHMVHILNNIVKDPTIEAPHNNNIQIGDGTTGTVIGNEVFGAFLTSPDWSGSGILVAGSSDVLISNNYVHDCEGGIQIVGYIYRTPAAPAVDNIIESNLVENCVTGISVQGDSISTIIRFNDVLSNDVGIGSLAFDYPWQQATPSGTDIYLNNIVGNEEGVKSSVWFWGGTGEVLEEEVDALLNWWGHVSGPGGVGPGSGDSVDTHVFYDPWLDEPYRERKGAFDYWGYNYGARIFNGPLGYVDENRGGDRSPDTLWGVPIDPWSFVTNEDVYHEVIFNVAGTKLVMKWSIAWHMHIFGPDGLRDTGDEIVEWSDAVAQYGEAWCTNHDVGSGEIGGETYEKMRGYSRIVWVGDTEGYTNPIWGECAIVHKVVNAKGVALVFDEPLYED